MLMSVFNKQRQKWEIEEYSDNLKNKSMFDFEKLKAAVTSISGAEAKYIEDLTSIKPPEWNNTDKNVSRGTVPDYEALRAEAVPNFFTTAFLQTAKVSPVHNVILGLLRSGSGPYEVIEWLVTELQSREKLLQDMIRKQGTETNY